MQQYIGIKLVNAERMTRGFYNDLRGWKTPLSEDVNDSGYLVEYRDGGPANHPNYKGYISWSPAAVFEKAYKATAGLNFGDALAALKVGHKVARSGWNGMWLKLVQAELPEGVECSQPVFLIGVNTEDGCLGFDIWLDSQTDMLAEDWEIVT